MTNDNLNAKQVTVTTAGTRVELSSDSLQCTNISIQASWGNDTGSTIIVEDRLGNVCAELAPGQFYFVPSSMSKTDLAHLYVDSSHNSEKANIGYSVN
jgi:hypothetical protein